MDQISFRIFIFKMGELILKEESGRMISNRVSDNLSCIKLNDEEDVETFEPEDIGSEEVTGKEGVPVSGEESFPRECWFDVTCFAEVSDDTSDGFVREIDVDLEEFITDSATTPKRILDLHLFDKKLCLMRYRRPSNGRSFFMGEFPVFGEDVFPGIEDCDRRDERKES